MSGKMAEVRARSSYSCSVGRDIALGDAPTMTSPALACCCSCCWSGAPPARVSRRTEEMFVSRSSRASEGQPLQSIVRMRTVIVNVGAEIWDPGVMRSV